MEISISIKPAAHQPPTWFLEIAFVCKVGMYVCIVLSWNSYGNTVSQSILLLHGAPTCVTEALHFVSKNNVATTGIFTAKFINTYFWL